MADTFITDLIVRIRYHLMEGTADKWSDLQLTEYINQAVGDLSRVRPYTTYSDTYFLGGTRLIDISSLNVYNVKRVEYELGDVGERKVPKEFKSYYVLGDYIEISDTSTPSGDLSVTGTADGDVASHLQDDTLAQFTSAMVYGKVVNTTDNLTGYATAYNDTGDLTLNEDIFPDGDEDYSVYEPVPVRVWYTTKHTYSETERTFSDDLEDIIVDGSVAYAMMGIATYTVATANIGGEKTSSNYAELARTKLTLYRESLRRLQGYPVTQRYS